VCEARRDGEHGVVVLRLATMPRNLQEELHQLDPLAQVRLAHNLRDDPQRLAVHEVAEANEVLRPKLGLLGVSSMRFYAFSNCQVTQVYNI
jgi:hypothetical protein